MISNEKSIDFIIIPDFDNSDEIKDAIIYIGSNNNEDFENELRLL